MKFFDAKNTSQACTNLGAGLAVGWKAFHSKRYRHFLKAGDTTSSLRPAS